MPSSSLLIRIKRRVSFALALGSVVVATCLFVAAPGCVKAAAKKQDEAEKQDQQDHSDHQGSTKHSSTNALAKESSPYLLMHAHNPVRWRAWNDESLALAKQQDKPIFLSIGYSSCHWCHVMERESFLDKEIADFLNEHFICIKVDREERPDVDEIYMHALLAIRRGGGGWPLSMFLTPEAKPFFGGTYWPARDGDRGSKMGFLTVVQRVHGHFRDNRELIERDADKVTTVTREMLAGREPEKGLPIQKSWARETVQQLAGQFDQQHGGFRFDPNNAQRPKFPEPSNLVFLIDRWRHPSLGENQADDREEVQRMLVKTCESMMLGGMNDHLGGGFHRYSVDRYWHIPHFEKMLYDNGQLATVYAEAYALTKRSDFRRTTEGILDFVTRELTAPEGGFYSSLDAESEGVEGKFYRWTAEQIKSTLKPEEFELFGKLYRINEPPNFEDKYYAPQLAKTLSQHAKELNTDESALDGKLQPIRKKLLEKRNQRVRPNLDDKILTAWNGLMIRGFADAGRILEREDYLNTARNAAKFALRELVNDQGRVLRTYTKGEAKLNGYLVDYACLIDGLLALHRATGESDWLSRAEQLQQKQNELFWDKTNGGYFYTSSDHEVLIARSKQMSDGAMPSGNSVAAANLWYLGQTLPSAERTQEAQRTVLSASSILTRSGMSLPRMLVTANRILTKRSQDD